LRQCAVVQGVDFICSVRRDSGHLPSIRAG